MKIINLSLNNDVVVKEPIVCCIGYFDGLHLGHKALFDKAISLTKDNNCQTAVISFNKDPKEIIKQTRIKHLLNETNKEQFIDDYGFDYYVKLDFSVEMMNLSIDDFHAYLDDRLNIKGLVCGFDFHYAHFGKGNGKTLSSYFKETYIVESIDYDERKISTTYIKEKLDLGKIEDVNNMLGYDYFINAKVIKGNQIGRNIGVPTANLKVSDYIYYPKQGVYKAYVFIEGTKYLALVNIGDNPSVSKDNKLKIEVHIIDFNGNLYDKLLYVYLVKRIRNEHKFASIEDLKLQLHKDIKEIKKCVSYFLNK